MVLPEHICPYGLKARDLLHRRGYMIDDRWLTAREATDAFTVEHRVMTAPQTFIDERLVGAYDDLCRFFGRAVRDPNAASYRSVIAVVPAAALMALAATWVANGIVLSWLTA